jgi:predicted transcriptional regulator
MDGEMGAWAEPKSVELSDELVARVDVLTERLRYTELGLHVQLNRELVIRLALLHGLDELEKSTAS